MKNSAFLYFLQFCLVAVVVQAYNAYYPVKLNQVQSNKILTTKPSLINPAESFPSLIKSKPLFGIRHQFASESLATPPVTQSLLYLGAMMSIMQSLNPKLGKEIHKYIVFNSKVPDLRIRGIPLLMSLFSHSGGFYHFLTNAMFLVHLGSQAERVYGKLGFGMIYLVTGLVCNAIGSTSNFGLGPTGCIFGIMGADACSLLINRRTLGKQVLGMGRQNIVNFLVASCFFGMGLRVNPFGNFIAFLVGAALALVIGPRYYRDKGSLTS